MLNFFLKSKKLRKDAVQYFEKHYTELLCGALDNITVSSGAEAIVHEYAVVYCFDHDLPYHQTELIKKCFHQWSKETIERGYSSVW